MIEATANSLQAYLAGHRQQIDTRLQQYCDFGDGCPDRLREAICYSLMSPGKRLRPLLVLMAAEACGSDTEAALPAACAVEMIHAYSLVHDDLPAMDDDDLRRGRPSCHAAFDEATAILVGDALLTSAFEVLARDISPAAIAVDCCVELARAAGAAGMVGGQADDLAAEHGTGDVHQLEHIHRRKTGALLTSSLRLGGIIASANAEQLGCLTAYGERLGLAFQIVDDLLDLTGREDTIGKRPGQDRTHGKLTYPSLIGPDASRARAERLIGEAISSLSPFGPRAVQLNGLARYVLERDR